MLERIIVDIGADIENIPKVVKGATQAKEIDNIPITLVGPKIYLSQFTGIKDAIYSGRIYGMHEKPSEVLSNKNADTSINIAAKLAARDNLPLISAGNSGATAISTIHHIGRLDHLKRTPIACTIPTFPDSKNLRNKRKIDLDYCVLADAGAILDGNPELLRDYAVLCSTYSELRFKKQKPLVGLIGFGEETEKTHPRLQEVYKLLSECTSINFVGNVEGNDLGRVDVLISQGYEGNLTLKGMEGGAKMVRKSIGRAIQEGDLLTKMKAFIARDIFRKAAEPIDQRNYVGILLGLKNLVFILHGASDEKAMRTGIKTAYTHLSIREELIRKSQEALNSLRTS